MGMIKIILFLLLKFCFLSSYSQEKTDTVKFNNSLFIKHIVDAGESLKIISKKYNVTVSQILEANEMDRNLYYNQTLYIPINNVKINLKSKKQFLETEQNKNITNIALLLPYYITKNDTMFNNFEDTSGISSLYFKASDVALSFHIGVQLAIDSLRNLGKNIVLHTFDTNRDSVKTQKIINSNILKNMDIIIGPLHANNFRVLCKKYGNDKSKVLVNPLSRKTNKIKKYNSVYQISISNKEQSKIIVNHIVKNYKNKRVLVLFNDKEEEFAGYVKHLFRMQKKTVNLFKIKYANVDSIRSLFNKFQVVFIPSINKPFVSKLLSSIGIMDSVSVVYGLDSWKQYENLDIDNLMELDVHFPISNFYNNQNNYEKSFLNLFEKKYNTNQGKYTFLGYNIIMHFCLTKNIFSFKKHNLGINENISAPIFHYLDYRLIKAD